MSGQIGSVTLGHYRLPVRAQKIDFLKKFTEVHSVPNALGVSDYYIYSYTTNNGDILNV